MDRIARIAFVISMLAGGFAWTGLFGLTDAAASLGATLLLLSISAFMADYYYSRPVL